jgi:hypothetical protein
VRARAFSTKLALVTVAALAIRLVYALVVMRHRPASGDGSEFHLLARMLAEQGRYIQPFPFLQHGVVVPTAEKPPLYPAYLAIGWLLGASSYAAQRALSCLLGAGTVLVIGLLGRRVDSERTGLVAACLAALYPMLVVLDGSGRSESLSVLLVALALLAAYRLRDMPALPVAAMLGALIGLAALTRSESILLLPLLALPAVWGAARNSMHGLQLAAALIIALAVVIGPYEVRNLTTYHRTVLLSTNEGGLLAGANCPAAYYGNEIGGWPCFPPGAAHGTVDESDVSWRLRRRALRYVRAHEGRLPAVAGVRVLRTWELWDVRDQAAVEATISERNLRAQQAGVVCLYLLALLAAWGVLLLRRRRRRVWPLLVPMLLVTGVSALTYGTSRFRAAADVPLVVLAAVGVSTLIARRGARRAA